MVFGRHQDAPDLLEFVIAHRGANKVSYPASVAMWAQLNACNGVDVASTSRRRYGTGAARRRWPWLAPSARFGLGAVECYIFLAMRVWWPLVFVAWQS